MYFTCDSKLTNYFNKLRGFRRFLASKKGRFIFHVKSMEKKNVPFFQNEKIRLEGFDIVYQDHCLHIYANSCYVRACEPYEQVELCIYGADDDRSNTDYDVLQCLYFIFRYRILFLDGIALHAAAVEVDGVAIAFMGFSGAGKSTQAKLWMQYKNAFPLNLDKPVVFFENGEIVISGTPWSGKEYAYANREALLKAIVFPKKEPRNLPIALSAIQGAIELLQNNLIYPLDDRIYNLYVNQIQRLAVSVALILFPCTISEKAVQVLYEHIFNKAYLKNERKRTQLKIKDGFVLRNIADEWIVIPRGKQALDFSATILLNETGAFLWNCLKINRTISELTDEMMSEYDVNKEIAENDVGMFVKQLQEAGVLELVTGE